MGSEHKHYVDCTSLWLSVCISSCKGWIGWEDIMHLFEHACIKDVLVCSLFNLNRRDENKPAMDSPYLCNFHIAVFPFFLVFSCMPHPVQLLWFQFFLPKTFQLIYRVATRWRWACFNLCVFFWRRVGRRREEDSYWWVVLQICYRE